ncbi:hypothetical protein [Pseudomonas monteilii]|uniref:hypothetical protein n=1 Tax=Pseudomonas monteilii TaxID=76759 RepID=UPI001E657725|nr:hypothetical protein [Pseudomonas monteilii]
MASAFETIVNNSINGRDQRVNRPTAVAAALELIAARMASATNPAQLENEMENLAKYADQIQEALNNS